MTPRRFGVSGVVRPGSTGDLSRSNQCRSTRIDEPAVAVELLISEAEIRDRLQAMGRQIEDDYRGKPLTIVAVLTGSLIALADLVRQIQHSIADCAGADQQLQGSDDDRDDPGCERGVRARRRWPRCFAAGRHP